MTPDQAKRVAQEHFYFFQWDKEQQLYSCYPHDLCAPASYHAKHHLEAMTEEVFASRYLEYVVPVEGRRIILTDWEKEFLLDRPADCLEGVLCDSWSETQPDKTKEETGEVTPEQAAEAVEQAIAQVESGEIDVSAMSELAREALDDMVAGSTWFGAMNDAVNNGEVSRQKFAADVKRLEALIAKLNAAGIEPEQPNFV